MSRATSGLRIVRIVLWATIAVLVAVTAAAVLLREQAADTRAAIGGPFELVDQDGAPVTEAMFAGRPHLIFFGFTHCPDICPTTLADLSMHFEALGPAGDPIVAAFVTVDPERDTPEVMKSYLSSFSGRIVGLTGSEAAIAKVVADYRAHRRKVPLEGGDYTMDHTAAVYLFGSDGDFRGTIDLTESNDIQLAKLKRLVGAS